MNPSGYKHGGGQYRYRAANSTKAAYQITTRRVAPPAEIGGVLCLGDATLPLIDLADWKGLRATPMGKGADNSTMTFVFWLGWYAMTSARKIEHAYLSGLCLGTALLSTALTRYSSSELQAANEYRSDNISSLTVLSSSSTPRGIADSMGTALGFSSSPTAYNPNNGDEDACVIIPDTFDADFLVIDDKLGTCTEMNWLVERWRG